MIRISLPYVYSIAEALEQLERIKPGNKLSDHIFDLWTAQNTVETLIQNSVFSHTLRSSRALAEALIRALRHMGNVDQDWNKELAPGEAFAVTNAYFQFKTALLAELGTLPNYFVTQKGSHDTLTLLDQPWRMLPSDLSEKAPEALFDVGEAGKALCYEIPTACGFHLFRAIEAVLRRYYTQVTNNAPPPKVRNIAVYIEAMRRKKCGDERILSVLSQLSRLHRNPLIHPEVILTMDEAISILGMAHSAITVMLSGLPKLEPTTTTTPPPASEARSS